jgi:hypothetical protein
LAAGVDDLAGAAFLAAVVTFAAGAAFAAVALVADVVFVAPSPGSLAALVPVDPVRLDPLPGVRLPAAGRVVFFTGSTPPTGSSVDAASSAGPPAAAAVVDFLGAERRESPVLMLIGPRHRSANTKVQAWGGQIVRAGGRVGPPPGWTVYPDSI